MRAILTRVEFAQECGSVLATDFFLRAIDVKQFIDKARLLIFQLYCRIHSRVKLEYVITLPCARVASAPHTAHTASDPIAPVAGRLFLCPSAPLRTHWRRVSVSPCLIVCFPAGSLPPC